jgi:type IV secretion system protein VirD4
MSGSISRGKNDPSQSLQMMERPLLTADELKSLPKGNFVIMKTGANPMKTVLRLFLDWGISFGKPYIMEEKSHRKVAYADKETLEENIILDMGKNEELESDEERRIGGMVNTQSLLSKTETGENKRRPTLRT